MGFSALDEVGDVLLSAPRDWAQDSPTTAATGIARSMIRFTANVIPDQRAGRGRRRARGSQAGGRPVTVGTVVVLIRR